MGTTILNWFLVRGEMSGACSALATGWPGIAVPPGTAHFISKIIAVTPTPPPPTAYLARSPLLSISRSFNLSICAHFIFWYSFTLYYVRWMNVCYVWYMYMYFICVYIQEYIFSIISDAILFVKILKSKSCRILDSFVVLWTTELKMLLSRKMKSVRKRGGKSLRHLVFPGGHPSKY